MFTNKDIILDNKVTKKIYPTQNNDDQLQFVFEPDPNLCCVKNNIKLHMCIELPKEYVPERGFAAKRFSGLAVELNSQRVSYPKTR